MKKLLSLFLCLFFTLLMPSCSLPEQSEGLSIVTTNFPLYDFTKQIVKDNATVTLLLQSGEESHSYEPTPQDIQKICHADLFLCIGGESEAWVDTVLNGADMKGVTVLRLIEFVTPLTNDNEEDSHHHTYDEHIWTSPKNAAAMTEAIAERLKEIAPEFREEFTANTSAFVHALSELDTEIRAIVSNAKRTTLIFGDRFPFTYFVHEYSLTYAAAYPGCAEASEPSAAVIAKLIQKVQEEDIPVVFCVELSTGQITDLICRETGAKKMVFHSCVNVSADEQKAGESYLSLMQKNLVALREALGDKNN